MLPKKVTSSSSSRQSVALTKGDWLDVMDHDGVWNVARVLSVPSPEEVEVVYDGWPEEYDEVVRVDSDRVAPFHTFTWAVKCWVKYLNWPMWPSVITIRTPGTEDGIKNLAMENRLYVDFLDDPDFAKRDQCWQIKRQVKIFNGNYDRNRMGTNGAQFERALECVLKSDATTKMPKFARGTLPLQYENSTTESVEVMRKHMGNRLWYRNFANNKDRHMHTHMYDVIGDEEEELTSNEPGAVKMLKVKRPRTSAAMDDRVAPTSQKPKKRPLPAIGVSVKIEKEPLAEVEVPYEFEPIDSSESEPEKEAVLAKKRRRVQGKSRPTPPVEGITGPKQEKPVASPRDSNAALAMPRHVTVMMDEIIVDDDSDGGSVVQRKVTKKTRTSPRRKYIVKSIPPRIKEESGNGVSFSEPEAVSLRASGRSTRTRQRVRRRKSEDAATLHRDAWDGMFSGIKSATPRSKRTGLYISSDDENDDSGYSDSFDPGTTSEDKAGSPFDSRMSSQETAEAFVADNASPARHAKLKTDPGCLDSTKIKRRGKEVTGNPKMAARRSIPHVSEDLSLTASAKPRYARSGRVLSDDDEDDSEGEEKGVLNTAIKAQAREELAAKKSITRHHNKQFKKSQNHEDVAGSMKSRQSKSPERSKVPVSLIEQRIASAHKALRLDTEKLQTTEGVTGLDQRKRASRAVPKSRVKTRSSMSRVGIKGSPLHQGETADGSFLCMAGSGHGLAKLSDVDGDHQVRRVSKNPLDLGLRSNQLGHSFLSVNEAYSSDSQESKHVPTPFDDDIDIRADPKVSPTMYKADAKVNGRISVDSKQVAEEKEVPDNWKEEKSHEVRRHVCVMRAGLEDALEMERDETIETPQRKRTVISVPRKFDEQEAPRVFTSPTDSMLRISSHPGVQSPSVFSSSAGFSMEKWFKPTLISGFTGAKT